jgi:hypothetical protein
MKFSVEIDSEELEKIYGKKLTQDEFDKLCSEAIATQLFTDQFMPHNKSINRTQKDAPVI